MSNSHFSRHVSIRTLKALCKSADSPTSLGLWLCAKYGDYRELASRSVRPADYVDSIASRMGLGPGVVRFARDYACISYLRKADFLPIEVDRDAVACSAFLSDELQNRETNRVWRRFLFDGAPLAYPADGSLVPPRIVDRLFEAGHAIGHLLTGRYSLSRVINSAGFGPGATALLPRSRAHVANKTLYTGDVTPNAVGLARVLLSGDPQRVHALTGTYPVGPVIPVLGRTFKPRLRLSNGSIEPVALEGQLVGSWIAGRHYYDKLVFVPKDALKSRTITAQAGVNLELQYGVADIIRDALRVWRIDLDSQEPNQEAAFRCFDPTSAPENPQGDATLDLTNASNRNARLPIQFLFDTSDDARKILSVMEMTRGVGYADPYHEEGDGVPYEMFSAMGNGYTFELETLVFAAIARACCTQGDAHRVRVFGDDIVVPKYAARDVADCLAAIGHEVNARKSYTSGLFYESCGKHYFEGFDVTPAYQKKEPTNAAELIRAHNRLVRLGIRHATLLGGTHVGCDVDVHAWVSPAVRTCLNEALTAGYYPQGDHPVRLPCQPISRVTIAPSRVASVAPLMSAYRRFYQDNLPVKEGDNYGSDGGFAVSFDKYISLYQRGVARRVRFRSGEYVTDGLQLRYDLPRRETRYDDATYASWLRTGNGSHVRGMNETLSYSRVSFWLGWPNARVIG